MGRCSRRLCPTSRVFLDFCVPRSSGLDGDPPAHIPSAYLSLHAPFPQHAAQVGQQPLLGQGSSLHILGQEGAVVGRDLLELQVGAAMSGSPWFVPSPPASCSRSSFLKITDLSICHGTVPPRPRLGAARERRAAV